MIKITNPDNKLEMQMHHQQKKVNLIQNVPNMQNENQNLPS